MKKNYLIILLCTISGLAIAQTSDVVKDYYPNEKGFGLMPEKMISTSNMIFFNGAEAMLDRGIRGIYYYYDAFVTDGTATNFNALDINPGQDLGQQSAPTKSFVVNDEIYFVATNGTTNGIYKVADATGQYSLVTSDWLPATQPKTHVFDAGKAVFVGANPADAADTKKYLLQWDGNAANSPAIINGHSGMYDANPSGDFASISVAGATYYVMSAKDPNDVNNVYQVCAIYYDRRSGLDKVRFTKINADVTKSDYPRGFVALGYSIYFDDSYGKVWKVDFSTNPGAVEVTDINTVIATGTNTTKMLGTYGDKLVFSAKNNGESTFSVFVYDPSSATVTKLNDGFEIRNSANPIMVDGKLYFEGQYNTIPYDNTAQVTPLWCYDGSTLQQLATDIAPVSNIHAFNNKVYFNAEDIDGAFLADGVTPASTLKELFVYDPNGTPTAIRPAFNSNNITVSPNPSNGYVNVTGIDANATYEIYSVAGSLLEQGAVVNGQIDYNVQSGVYLLKVTEGSNTKVVKIMVK